MAYNVLIVDDQIISRQLFESTVAKSDNYRLAASIESAKVADTYCARGNIDLILMDVVMSDDSNGLDAAKKIKERWPGIKIIIMTSMPDAALLKKAKEYNVDSFWYKEVQDKPMLDVMDMTMAGEKVWPTRLPNLKLGLASSSELTQREYDVLRKLVKGLSDKEIADELNMSYNTVRVHMSALISKTGFASRTELALKAARSGIVVADMDL